MSKSGSLLDRQPKPPFGHPPRSGHPDALLRGLAVAATATTVLLVAVGGLVRATESGLGCPGWPKCFGRWVPPLEYHAVIEYSHRLLASVDLILIGVLALVAWRRHRQVARVVRPAVGALGVVIVQAGLGAVVVEGELDALLVTAHFATAMVLVGVLAYATVAAYSTEWRAEGRPGGLSLLARATAGATFALMLVGAYVRGEGAGLAFADWPLMDGRAIPSLDFAGEALHFAHRLLALAVGGLVVTLAVRAWRMGSSLAFLATLSAGLFLAQALVGAANVWTGLSAWAVVSHVTLAALTWATLVAVAAAARVRGQPALSGGVP